MWGIPLEKRHKRNKIESEEAIIRKGTHEPIISEEMYELAQKRLKAEYSYKAQPPESQIHWLSGILRCSACGRTLVSSGGRVPSFQCSGYKRHQCKTSHFTRASKIEEAVIDSFLGATKDKNLIFSNLVLEDKSSEIKLLYDKLDKCNKKEDRIKVAYRDGVDTIDEYKQNKLLITKEKTELQAKIAEIKTKANSLDNVEMRKRIANVYNIVSSVNTTRDEKNHALKSIVRDIIYDKSASTIHVSYFLS